MNANVIDNLATATPRQIDERLADLHGTLDHALARQDAAQEHVRRLAGQRKGYGRGAAWSGSWDDAIAAVRVVADTDTTWRGHTAAEALDELDARDAAVTDARAALIPFNAEYQRRPWSRFFLVTSSSGGHIHASTACSTTRLTTTFGWLPSVSGKSEADAVAEHGPLLCTVCFPSAPVEWTIGKTDPDRCPGSNTHPDRATITTWRNTRYAPCPECGKEERVSMSGIRKHKRPTA